MFLPMQSCNHYKSSSNSQLITGKSRFLEKKLIFLGNKTVNQRFGANLQKRVFAKICCKFLAFLQKKMLKMTISISVWGSKYTANSLFQTDKID